MKTFIKILLVLTLTLGVLAGCGGEEGTEKKVTIYNDTTVRGDVDEEKVAVPRLAMRGSLGDYYPSELQPEYVVPDFKSVINKRAGNYPGPEHPYVPKQALQVDTWSHDGYIENLKITGSRNEGYVETAGYAGRTCDGYIECMR